MRNEKIILQLSEDMPVFHTRAMRQEFISIKKTVILQGYRYPATPKENLAHFLYKNKWLA